MKTRSSKISGRKMWKINTITHRERRIKKKTTRKQNKITEERVR